MEDTKQRVSIALDLHENKNTETILHLACSALDEDGMPISGVHLQGYLYLSGVQGDTVFCLSIPRGKCSPSEALARTVFYDEYHYNVDYANRIEHIENVEKRYFVRKARDEGGQVWLGLPIHSNAIFEVGLSVGPNYRSNRSSSV